MDATDELRDLYPTLANQETRVAALEAFSLAGDSQTLRQVLNTETDPELRRTAIHGIAMEDGEEAAQLLESVYKNAASVEEKRVVLEALVMMNEAEELALKIVHTETDSELRRVAIHMLGVMQATTVIAELYASIDDVELRKDVLESMMVADDTEGLIKVMQSEKNAELRAVAMQMLVNMGSEVSDDFLFELLEDKG